MKGVSMIQSDDLVLVEQAREGDRAALDELIQRMQRPVYNLALRMLQHPADAEDATQEILIKVITHLATFKGEAGFMTWVYRIASNYLLTTRRRRAEQQTVTFDSLSEKLQASLALGEASIPEQVEYAALLAEVRINCTTGMLLCLDRPHRLALILGEVLHLSGDEAAYILELPAATYRKQLSRARANLLAFVNEQCGLVNPANPCRCSKHIGNKLKYRLMDAHALTFAAALDAQQIAQQADALCDDLNTLRDEVDIIRALPDFRTPVQVLDSIRALLAGRESALT